MIPPQTLVKGSLWPMFREDVWVELAIQRRALKDGFEPREYRVPNTDPKLVFYYDCSSSLGKGCTFRVRVDTFKDENRKVTTEACTDHNHTLKPHSSSYETKAGTIIYTLEKEVRRQAVLEIKRIGEAATGLKEAPTTTRQKQDGVLEDVRVALGEEWMNVVRERAAKFLVTQGGTESCPLMSSTSASRSSSTLGPAPVAKSWEIVIPPSRYRSSSRQPSAASEARDAYPTPETSVPPTQDTKPLAVPRSNAGSGRAKRTRSSEGEGTGTIKRGVENVVDEVDQVEERSQRRPSIYSTREFAPAPEVPPLPLPKLEPSPCSSTFPSPAVTTPTLARYLSTLDETGAFDFSCYLPALRRGSIDTHQQLSLLIKSEKRLDKLFEAFKESDEREYRTMCIREGSEDRDRSLQPGLWRREVFRDLLIGDEGCELERVSSQVKEEIRGFA